MKKVFIAILFILTICLGLNQYFQTLPQIAISPSQISNLLELSKNHPYSPEFYLKIKPSGIGAEQFNKFQDAPGQSKIYLTPGKSFTDYIRVNNNSNSPTTFYLDAVDQYKNEKGETFYNLPEAKKSTLASNIKFVENSVTVQPNSFRLVKYEVNVPADQPETSVKIGISTTVRGTAAKGATVVTNLRVVVGTDFIVSKNTAQHKLYTWPNLPTTSIYLLCSILMLQIYVVYLRAASKYHV